MLRLELLVFILVALSLSVPVTLVQQSRYIAATPESKDWPLFGGLISISSARDSKKKSAPKPYISIDLSGTPSPQTSLTPTPTKKPDSSPPDDDDDSSSSSFIGSLTYGLSHAPDWLFPFSFFNNPFKAPKPTKTEDPYADDNYRGPTPTAAMTDDQKKCAKDHHGDTTQCKSPFWWLWNQAPAASPTADPASNGEIWDENWKPSSSTTSTASSTVTSTATETQTAVVTAIVTATVTATVTTTTEATVSASATATASPILLGLPAFNGSNGTAQSAR